MKSICSIITSKHLIPITITLKITTRVCVPGNPTTSMMFYTGQPLLTSSSLQTQVVLEHAVHYSSRHAFQKLYPVINGSGLEAVTTEKFGFPRLHISLCNHRKVMTKLTLVAYLSCRSATRMNQESYTRIRVKINLNDADF